MATEYVWQKKDVFTLINLYKEHPYLWNPAHPEYKDREIRHTAIKKISEQMEVPKREIERKFKNLLSHFLRELKRESAKKSYKTKWFAFDALSYIKERPLRGYVYMNKNKKGELVRGKVEEDEEEEDDYDNSCEFEVTFKDDNADAQDSGPEVSIDPVSHLPQTIKKSNSTDDPLIDDSLFRPVDNSNTSLAFKDDATIFGEHIANKIRSMNARTRAIVEYEINSTIFKAEMGYFCNKKIDLNSLSSTLE